MGGFLSIAGAPPQSVAALDDASKPFFGALTSIHSLPDATGDEASTEAWLRLLSFQFSVGRALTLREVEHKAAPLLDALALNDGLSGNRRRVFAAVAVLCDAYRLGSHETARFDVALGNLAFVARLTARHLVQVGGASAVRLLSATPFPHPQHRLLGSALIHAVVAFVVDVPVTARNYSVHFELVTLLSVLLGGELVGHEHLPLNDAFYALPSLQAARLVTILLHNFASPRALPAATVLDAGGGSVLYSLATTAFDTVLSLASPATGGGGAGGAAAAPGTTLNDASLLLLLLAIRKAPFRRAFGLLDSVDIWRAVFERLAGAPLDEPQQLLLYALFQNASFLEHVLSRVDVERLVEPMLRVLYVALDAGAATHLQFLMLTCLMRLSATVSFNRSLHLVSLDTVPWYRTAVLSRINLESLLVLLVLQALHRNLTQHRDQVLHLLVRAILLNVSVTLEELHAVPAEKMVRLLQTVQRKLRQLDGDAGAGEQIAALEDVLELLLLVLVRATFGSASHSPCIVYALINVGDSMRALSTHARLGASARQLLRVIEHFAAVVGDTSVRRPPTALVTLVRDEVRRAFAAPHGPLCRTQAEPERALWALRDPRPKLFSLLVWRAVVLHSVVAWDQKSLRLSVDEDDESAEASER
jgi:hypothetical protein